MDHLPKFPVSSCPYLGTFDDSEVHFGFPTQSNYCYRVNPPGAVNISHQETHCLQRAYTGCPVYQSDWGGPLPQNLRAIPDQDVKRAIFPFGDWRILAFGFVFLFILILYFLIPFRPNQNDSLETDSNASLVSHTSTVNTDTPQPTASHTAQPTATPQPSVTPSITPTPSQTSTDSPPSLTPGPLLDTPFTTNRTYLIHQVKEGESLPLLANRFQTRQEVIQIVNASRLIYGTLPNIFLVLMPGQTETLDLIELDLVYLDDAAQIADFSSQYGISEDELREYNGLESGEIIPPGRWLVFPNREVTPTITLTPVVTADLTQALTAPFGPNNEYVLHRVKSTENISTLETLYLTSRAVIQESNIIQGSIRIDQVLVILPDVTDPTGLTTFRVTQLDTDISVEDLADQLGVPASDLVYYNDLTPGQILTSGQWIIYPAQP